MKFHRSVWVTVSFLIIGAVAAWWLWPELPARVPSHWNAAGEVDRTMPRLWAALFPILTVAGFAALSWLLAFISPNRYRVGAFASVYFGLMLAIQGFVLVLGICMLLFGAGYPLPMPKVAVLGLGALFTILGNYMGKLRRNFFIGIRTPWTIASEATWERTHRLGGKLFVLAGLTMLVGTLFGMPFPLAMGVLLVAGLFPALYSYVIYRRVEGPPHD
ncbi:MULTISPECIES: SdpI family protein [Oleiagrimonas]|uniref:SdpI family protein n=1 Tax=Oleiagrimonas citrea TaxID=1665687 RepID=A0A846ZKU7_9GAMM|nr:MULTISPECIES: SdpI family protein [Oleiagrimonas]NKZ38945.1 SdpI family protein [Oleiagrimonas citrea]RAP57597.1 hypothetical protein BTJ49_06670 [Oleiagrimonas sp. MCCC 1A03011]